MAKFITHFLPLNSSFKFLYYKSNEGVGKSLDGEMLTVEYHFGGDVLDKNIVTEVDGVQGSVGNILENTETYEDMFDRLDKTNESPAKILGKMLSDWEKGLGVDRAKYMTFIQRACEKSKMNGNPDARIYYMIMGLGVQNPGGEVLLNESYAKEIQSHIGDLPLLEFFADKKSPKKDGQIVPIDTPGAVVRSWNSNDFIQWTNRLKSDSSFIMTGESQNRMRDFTNMNIALSRETHDRIAKKVKSGSVMDPDDAFTLQSGYDEDDVKRDLTLGENDRPRLTDDFWLNWLVGQGENLFSSYELLQKNDKEYGDKAGWKNDRKVVLESVDRYLKSIKTAIPKLSGEESGKVQSLSDHAMKSGNAYGTQSGKVSINALEVALRAFESESDKALASEKALSAFVQKVERGSDGYTFQVKSGESAENKDIPSALDHDDAYTFLKKQEPERFSNKNILKKIGGLFK